MACKDFEGHFRYCVVLRIASKISAATILGDSTTGNGPLGMRDWPISDTYRSFILEMIYLEVCRNDGVQNSPNHRGAPAVAPDNGLTCKLP